MAFERLWQFIAKRLAEAEDVETAEQRWPRRMDQVVADLSRKSWDDFMRSQKAFLEIIKEKDSQIRMVLEEKYFRPVVRAASPPPESNVRVEPEDMNDVTQFPADSDKDAITKQQEAERVTREKLALALAEGETEILVEAAEAGQGEKVADTLTAAVQEIAEEQNREGGATGRERIARAVEEFSAK